MLLSGGDREALRHLIPPILHSALRGLWNYRPAGALLFMSKAFSRAGHQQTAETSGHCYRKSDALEGELDAAAKAPPPKWRTRLQRGLLKIWMGCSVLWIGCILAILGQCLYGPWIGWQQPQCDGPLANPVETYLADIGIALGPPAAVLLLHRVVMWWSKRVRRSQ
jgi:hypothetical protein